MKCGICRVDKGAWEVSDADNQLIVTVCEDCLVRSVQWAQNVTEEWDDSYGESPYVAREDVSYIAPIYDFIEEL